MQLTQQNLSSFDRGETGFTQTLDSYQRKWLSVYTIGATTLRNVDENDFDAYGSVIKGNIIMEGKYRSRIIFRSSMSEVIKVLNDNAIMVKNHL